MSCPSILLHLDDDAHAEVRNDEAVRLAWRLKSHLDGLSCHRPVPVGTDLGAAMGAMTAELTRELQRARREAVERVQRFRALCGQRGLAAFQGEVDDDEDAGRAILRRAAVHDLVVLGQPDPADDEAYRRRDVMQNVLLHSPRPTLLLPYTGRFDDFGRTVLVAWDGSDGAARAATHALPLLGRAASVRVVIFDHGASPAGVLDQARAQAVATWLGRHGLRVQAEVRHQVIDVGNALLSHAADTGADLLVMGSWGHSRLAERLAGGATRTVLETMTLPVLTSH